MKITEPHRAAVTFPATGDYRMGRVIAFFFAAVGVTMLVLAASEWRGQGFIHKDTALMAFYGMIVILAAWALGRKGRLGLWLMYAFCAIAVHSALSQLWDASYLRSRDAIYKFYIEFLLFGFCLLLTSYFYRRRSEFTGFWQSPKSSRG